MSKYIRVNIVEAEPMTAYEFDNLKGREHSDENCEGYKIVYDDGYVSWCPKARFDEVSRPIDGMTFGQAIDACRYRGARIQRKNWNGIGQYVEHKVVEVCYPEESKLVQSHAFVFHFVNCKTGEAGIQVGWLASQADMAADDWVIVE